MLYLQDQQENGNVVIPLPKLNVRIIVANNEGLRNIFEIHWNGYTKDLAVVNPTNP